VLLCRTMCNHEAQSEAANVEMRKIAEQPGRVLFGLCCLTCNEVLSEKWFPVAVRCWVGS
jgi:hypothetical protein